MYSQEPLHPVGLLSTGKVVLAVLAPQTHQRVLLEPVAVPITLEQETTVQDVGVQLEP